MKTQTFGVERGSLTFCNLSLLHHRIAYLRCQSAGGDYKKHRFNGTQEDKRDNPPYDGKITWRKGRVEEGYVFGVKNIKGEYEYEVRYDEGPKDKEWMEKNDIKYLKQLLDERKLKETEPDVWRLREMGGAQRTDIGEWWSQKLKLSNIGDVLARSEQDYKQFINREAEEARKRVAAEKAAAKAAKQDRAEREAKDRVIIEKEAKATEQAKAEITKSQTPPATQTTQTKSVEQLAKEQTEKERAKLAADAAKVQQTCATSVNLIHIGATMKTQNFGTWRSTSSSAVFSTSPSPSWFNDRELFILSFFVVCLHSDYKEKRFNGSDRSSSPPFDGTITWINGRLVGDKVYGVKNAEGEYEYECRYDEGPKDREWMEANDKKYLKQLLDEGKLKEAEPDVWCLREIDKAQRTDIGEWWSGKLAMSNISDKLKSAANDYEQFIAKEQERAAKAKKDEAERQRLLEEKQEQERAVDDCNNRGNVKYGKGDYDGAIAYFEKARSLAATKTSPRLAFAYNKRGNVKSKKGDYDGAIKDCDEAIKLNPKYAAAYNNRGNVKYAKGEHNGAIEDYSNAIKLKPNYALYHSNLGEIYLFEEGNIKEAKEHLERASANYNENDRHLPVVKANLDYILGRDKYEAALRGYTQAIDNNKNNASLYYLRGRTYAELGRYNEAKQDYEKALSMNYIPAREAMETMQERQRGIEEQQLMGDEEEGVKTLEATIEDNKGRIGELEGIIERNRRQNETEQIEREKLLSEIQRLEELLNRAVEDKSKIEEARRGMENEKGQIMSELERLTREQEDRKEAVEQLEEMLKKVRVENVDLDEALKELEERLNKETSEKNAELQNMQDELKQSQAKLAQKKELIEKEKAEKEKLSEEMKQESMEHAKQIKGLETELTKKNKELIQKLNKKSEELVKKSKGLRDQINRNKQLEQEIKENKIRIEELGGLIGENQIQSEKLKKELEKLNRTNREEQTDERIRLEKQMEELRQKQEEMKSEIENLKQEKETKEANIKEVKEKMANLEEENEKIKGDKQELQDKFNAEKQKIIGKIDKNIDDWIIDTLDKQIEEWEEKIKESPGLSNILDKAKQKKAILETIRNEPDAYKKMRMYADMKIEDGLILAPGEHQVLTEREQEIKSIEDNLHIQKEMVASLQRELARRDGVEQILRDELKNAKQEGVEEIIKRLQDNINKSKQNKQEQREKGKRLGLSEKYAKVLEGPIGEEVSRCVHILKRNMITDSFNRNEVLTALERLEELEEEKVKNTFAVVYDLLKILGHPKMTEEDETIKRAIAKIVHKYIPWVFINVWMKKKTVVDTKTKIELENLIKSALARIPNKERTALRYYLENMLAGIGALKSEEGIFKNSLLGAVSATIGQNVGNLFGLLRRAIKEQGKTRKGMYYLDIVWIYRLSKWAIESEEQLNELQSLLKENSNNWRIVYAGIEALTEVIKKGKTESIRRQALLGKQAEGKIYPGLTDSLLTTHKEKEIRKKVVESCQEIIQDNDKSVSADIKKIAGDTMKTMLNTDKELKMFQNDVPGESVPIGSAALTGRCWAHRTNEAQKDSGTSDQEKVQSKNGR